MKASSYDIGLAKNLLSFYLFAETPIKRNPTKKEVQEAMWVILDWFGDRNVEFDNKQIKNMKEEQRTLGGV